MNRLVTAVVLGQLVGLLGWIDPLFFPLLLAAPLVSGAVVAKVGYRARWIAVLWLSAGFNMLWTDWVFFREDVAFHAAVAVVTALLSLAGWGLMSLALRGRRGSRVSV